MQKSFGSFFKKEHLIYEREATANGAGASPARARLAIAVYASSSAAAKPAASNSFAVSRAAIKCARNFATHSGSRASASAEAL